MAEFQPNLWAPWRMQYIQGLSDPSVCFLCDYLASADKDKAHYLLWRSAEAFVVFNKFPYNNGHLLVAPNRHMADLNDASDAELLTDFTDFMGGPLRLRSGEPCPDPLFRERLRSRLWRTHAHSRLRQTQDVH